MSVADFKRYVADVSAQFVNACPSPRQWAGILFELDAVDDAPARPARQLTADECALFGDNVVPFAPREAA